MFIRTTSVLISGVALAFGLAACGAESIENAQSLKAACQTVMTDILDAYDQAEVGLDELSESNDFVKAQEIYVRELRAIAERIENADIKQAIEVQADGAEATTDLKVKIFDATKADDMEKADELSTELLAVLAEHNKDQPTLNDLCMNALHSQ